MHGRRGWEDSWRGESLSTHPTVCIHHVQFSATSAYVGGNRAISVVLVGVVGLHRQVGHDVSHQFFPAVPQVCLVSRLYCKPESHKAVEFLVLTEHPVLVNVLERGRRDLSGSKRFSSDIMCSTKAARSTRSTLGGRGLKLSVTLPSLLTMR